MTKVSLQEREEKFDKAAEGSSLERLFHDERLLLKSLCLQFAFSFQEIRQLITMAVDLQIWGGSSFSQLINRCQLSEDLRREQAFSVISSLFESIKIEEKDYSRFPCPSPNARPLKIINVDKETQILGTCPVASEKTRCCNLKTLDVIKNCGFDCSYCSIQSFYYDDSIYVENRLEEKLNNLQLDANKRYHIGTGQSSDSLMWGNRNGILDALFSFARKHPNIVLELKSKSSNIKELLELDIPKNVITTWSLNTPTIIENEEHYTASLSERLHAAKCLQERGRLIGFHFHPMVIYPNCHLEYQSIVNHLEQTFDPKMIAMISMGTLTFIKPVLKKLRNRMIQSKILQMPLEEIAGKLSYPLAMKEELFSAFFQHFSANWKQQIFFYLCMEDISLWKKVFDREYASNELFEQAMLEHYFAKINQLSD